jgi:hypothetical protein
MTTILFIVSLCALFFMLTLKVFDLKVRKLSFLSNIYSKGDRFIHGMIDKMVYLYNRYKKISRIFIFEFLPSYAYEILVKMKDYVAKRYYMAGDDFRGRRVLRSTGSVSFFLERLSDDKNI